jgi:hypothetical protein
MDNVCSLQPAVDHQYRLTAPSVTPLGATTHLWVASRPGRIGCPGRLTDIHWWSSGAGLELHLFSEPYHSHYDDWATLFCLFLLLIKRSTHIWRHSHSKKKSVSLCFATFFTLVSCLANFSILKIEVTCSSETSVDFYRTTRRYNQRSENFKSYVKFLNLCLLYPGFATITDD